jgi:hypothetical protein
LARKRARTHTSRVKEDAFTRNSGARLGEVTAGVHVQRRQSWVVD